MSSKWLTLAALCAICAAVPVRAHHSHGNYDLTTWTTMNGEVKEVHLHGVERDWDGDGGTGFNTAAPVTTPR